MTIEETKELKDLLTDVYDYVVSFATMSKEEKELADKTDKFISILAKELK